MVPNTPFLWPAWVSHPAVSPSWLLVKVNPVPDKPQDNVAHQQQRGTQCRSDPCLAHRGCHFSPTPPLPVPSPGMNSNVLYHPALGKDTYGKASLAGLDSLLLGDLRVPCVLTSRRTKKLSNF